MLRVGLVALGICVAFGCTTASKEATPSRNLPRQRVKLVATETENQVTLRWQSEPGVEYGVVYTTNLNDIRSWKLVPAQESIPGTGGIMTVQFPPPIPGLIHYRLSEKPLGP